MKLVTRCFLRHSTPKDSFTLVELMITVVVLLTLSSIAFRSFSDFLEQRKLRQAAIELAGLLRTSRTLAVKNAASCQIIQTSSSTATFGANSSFTGNTCTSSNVPPLSLRAAAGSNAVSATDATFTFTRSGFAAGSSATTLISSPNSQSRYCVSLTSPSAIVRIGWTNGSAVSSCNFRSSG